MQTKREQFQQEMTLLPPLESLIPKDHYLYRLNRVLDLSFIHDFVRDRYCQDNGRPSIDPEVIVRLFLIQAMDGISHVRELMRHVSVADPVIDPDLLPPGSRGRGDPEGQGLCTEGFLCTWQMPSFECSIMSQESIHNKKRHIKSWHGHLAHDSRAGYPCYYKRIYEHISGTRQ